MQLLCLSLQQAEGSAVANTQCTSAQALRTHCYPPLQSYLKTSNLLAAAICHEAGAVHPGYGFLSENAEFVSICREHGLAFIGPDPEHIRVMGDKATARKTMMDAGVPCVPGSPGLVNSEAEAQEVRVSAACLRCAPTFPLLAAPVDV